MLTGGPAWRRSESLGFVPVGQKFPLRPGGRGNSLNKTILDASGTRNGSDLAASPREPRVYFKGELQPAEGQSQRKAGHLQGPTKGSMSPGVCGLTLYPPRCLEPGGKASQGRGEEEATSAG